MTSLQLYLKDGKWFDKESGLEISNPEVAFTKSLQGGWWKHNEGKPYDMMELGVFYPWEGEWEKVEQFLNGDGNHWLDWNGRQMSLYGCKGRRQVLRLLPKSPVKDRIHEMAESSIKMKGGSWGKPIGGKSWPPKSEKGAGDPYPIIDQTAFEMASRHVDPSGKEYGTELMLNKELQDAIASGIVATGGIPEQDKDTPHEFPYPIGSKDWRDKVTAFIIRVGNYMLTHPHSEHYALWGKQIKQNVEEIRAWYAEIPAAPVNDAIKDFCDRNAILPEDLIRVYQEFLKNAVNDAVGGKEDFN